MWGTARPPTTLSFLPSTRLKQERVGEGGGKGFQIRYANQIAKPKTGGESESNADLKLGNECGESWSTATKGRIQLVLVVVAVI